MCGIHLGNHLKTLEKHKFEVLDINLEQPRLQTLLSETFKRIQKINEAEKMIAYTSESLIKTIEKAQKHVIGRLDILRKKYFEILEHKKFCKSEMPIIEKIETMVLEVKTLEIDKIMDEIQQVYGDELIYYLEKEKLSKEEEERRKKEDEERRRKEVEERLRKQKEVETPKKEEEERRRKEEEERLHPERSNSYIEMSLKEKIDYYHPIVLGGDLNRVHEIGRELLVSNDGKYLFFCKLHLGI